MISADPADVALACALCDRADEITTAAFGSPDLAVHTKSDQSPVSDADREVELFLRDALARERPGDEILGEEFGDTASRASGEEAAVRRWIIDPIDGTANFIRHYPMWATLLALEVDGELTVGVVSAPALGRRWWAGKGLGAFTTSLAQADPIRMGVSRVEEIADAYVLGASLNYWADAGLNPGGWLDLTGRALWDRTVGDFWTHMLVAEGCAEIGVDPFGNLWDLAALKVIVEEAGGTFTDFSGERRADRGNGVSSNGHLHSDALEILNRR